MEPRKVFDTIPEEFDKYRPRYCPEAFSAITEIADLRPGRSILEIGPGTGQATEPLLQTGADYLGIELGEHLYEFMKRKFASYPNLSMVCDDFITHDFGEEKFDMVFSAATIQWIPEKIAFTRSFELLKPGGTLMMIANLSDNGARNSEALVKAEQEVYDRFYVTDMPYTQRIDKFACVNYGFSPAQSLDFFYDTDMTADEFAASMMTNADTITMPEPNRTLFMNGLKNAVNDNGGVWRRHDRVNLVWATKPR